MADAGFWISSVGVLTYAVYDKPSIDCTLEPVSNDGLIRVAVIPGRGLFECREREKYNAFW
jgi:hypothetical protein